VRTVQEDEEGGAKAYNVKKRPVRIPVPLARLGAGSGRTGQALEEEGYLGRAG
jgi:hypothetical protein